MKNYIIGRKLKNLSMETKITQISSKSIEKSKREVREKKSIMKREKMMKNYEVRLIYTSKLKSNARWRYIRVEFN